MFLMEFEQKTYLVENGICLAEEEDSHINIMLSDLSKGISSYMNKDYFLYNYLKLQGCNVSSYAHTLESNSNEEY